MAVQLDIDWPKFLAKHDLLWNTLPKSYFEGAFVGNGVLGAIFFKDGQSPNTLRFEIGRTDVYDHRSPETPIVHGRERLPIGQLLLSPAGKITKVKIRTDLWNAETRGELTTKRGTITFRCFVPSGEEVIVLNMKGTGKETNAACSFRPQQAISPRFLAQPKRDKGFMYEPNPPFRVENTDSIEVVTQPLLVGDDYATAWCEKTDSDGSRTVLITVAYRWAKSRYSATGPVTGSAIDAVATIKSAQAKDIASMERAHREWWHKFYPASFVSIPDARLESFYWIQLYKLASATRTAGPVIDLMGPWFMPTIWPCLWLNLNVQLTYYTLGITNHLDMEDPLYRLIEKHTDQLIQNVPQEFQHDCAALGNPVGYDELNTPVFLTEANDCPKEMNLIVLPWLMQQFYLHYRRTMDDRRLRDIIYPLMRRAFNVYLRVLHLGEDGLYHIPFTFSDEYGKAHETSLNIALARWGFTILIECAARLKIDDPLLPRWKTTLANMADYPTNENGIMIGKDVPFAKPHRHYSHLFAIFPLYEMNIDNHPERIPMMKKSISHFTDIDGDNCMYKFSGASSLWAALGEGDNALKWLHRSVEIIPQNFLSRPKIPTATRNTMYNERGNPTFESPISSARCILDMLIQSWGGLIRVFPAMPTQWKDASFHNLRTEGAFLVSAVRKGGQTQFIRVESLAGEPCKIKIDELKDMRIKGPKTTQIRKHDGLIELNLKKGEEIVLYFVENADIFVISPLPTKNESINFWGRSHPIKMVTS